MMCSRVSVWIGILIVAQSKTEPDGKKYNRRKNHSDKHQGICPYYILLPQLFDRISQGWSQRWFPKVIVQPAKLNGESAGHSSLREA